jgi:hypothetical protein
MSGNMRSVSEGLALLLRHDPEGYCSAEHDELFAGGPPPADMHPKDAKALESLGWTYNERFTSWVKSL